MNFVSSHPAFNDTVEKAKKILARRDAREKNPYKKYQIAGWW